MTTKTADLYKKELVALCPGVMCRGKLMTSLGQRLYHEQDIERQYYANTLRTNLSALIQKTDDKYPWQHEDWQQLYPYLSKFLNDRSSEYGKTEEDYFNIVSDVSRLCQKDKWVATSLHESLGRDLKKYVVPKPLIAQSVLRYLAVLLLGVVLGSLLF